MLVRVGSHGNQSCARLVTADGSITRWYDQMMWLGICINRSKTILWNCSSARKSLNANAFLGKVGSFASEEVMFQLIKF